MQQEFLYSVPLWLIAIVLIGLFVGSAWGAHWWGRISRKKPNASAEAVTEILPTSILGLLALLLGFTFSMAINRYEDRKSLVMKEANALGTTYLRTQMLAPEQGRPLRELLKQYTQHRLVFFDVMKDAQKVTTFNSHSQDLLSQMWQLAVTVTQKDKSPIAGLFVSSLNDVIDLDTERVFASKNHVPEIVYYIIILITLLGLTTLSFVIGYKGQRNSASLFLAVLFAFVIIMIQDLDRPGRGLIQVGEQSLIDLSKSMN
ncbi:DUF4239 domain-containing protein [Bdellovibrio sp. 22V]|uniref:bestrophin-like domain n=1 Tax=Bdellovibrio sp. 22V TaxID=3044166 RepID=UPI002542CD0E|nr:DUF4239 domain-containing protein [Bdellovibrio sp. 22V]WII73211.1 DUF4239 domain-containing protein [Bdellovibrio sp. 22V]